MRDRCRSVAATLPRRYEHQAFIRHDAFNDSELLLHFLDRAQFRWDSRLRKVISPVFPCFSKQALVSIPLHRNAHRVLKFESTPSITMTFFSTLDMGSCTR